MANLSRGGWVGLLVAMRKLCRYYGDYRTKFPIDLPVQITAALDAICAATALLELYDKQHQGGNQ